MIFQGPRHDFSMSGIGNTEVVKPTMSQAWYLNILIVAVTNKALKYTGKSKAGRLPFPDTFTISISLH